MRDPLGSIGLHDSVPVSRLPAFGWHQSGNPILQRTRGPRTRPVQSGALDRRREGSELVVGCATQAVAATPSPAASARAAAPTRKRRRQPRQKNGGFDRQHRQHRRQRWFSTARRAKCLLESARGRQPTGPMILTVAEDHRIGRLPGDRQAAVDAAEATFGLQERARRPR